MGIQIITSGGLVRGVSTVPYATTLPASPGDGQEAILVDSVSTPTYQWRFRYNASSGNTDKWEFTGGAPAYVEVTTLENRVGSAYGALTTAGPSFTVPNGGVYFVSLGFAVDADASTNDISAWMSYDIGGTGAVDADGVGILAIHTNVPISNRHTSSRTRRKTIAASTALVSKYKSTHGTPNTGFQDRWISVVPVRVS